jgi:hypothetical protein
MRTAVAVAFVVGALAFTVSAVPGQVIRGRVVDATTQRGIREVEVTLTDSAGTQARLVVTDSVGAFRFMVDAAGSYKLRAERIGYTATSVEGVQVERAEEIEIQLKMGVEAIPLEPLVVVARRPERLGRLGEFYDRLEWMGKLGTGRFITRAEIEARNPSETTDLLRTVPGLRVTAARNVVVTRQGSGCPPSVFIDGMLLTRDNRSSINDFVVPQVIEGVEIYRGPSEVPPQYHDRAGCGAILIWTRRGAPTGKPWSWWRAAVGGGLLLTVILLAR